MLLAHLCTFGSPESEPLCSSCLLNCLEFLLAADVLLSICCRHGAVRSALSSSDAFYFVPIAWQFDLMRVDVETSSQVGAD